MKRKLIIYVFTSLLAAFSLSLDRVVYAHEKKAETISFCQLTSQLDSYRGKMVTMRVRVKTYRHGATISDQACPKVSLLLVPDRSAVQANDVSHFYQFLAEHRRSSKAVFATVTGRLVKGEDDGFVLKRDVVFELESVSEISERAKTGDRKL